jgi:methanogenic corrinoid protein MtbC1
MGGVKGIMFEKFREQYKKDVMEGSVIKYRDWLERRLMVETKKREMLERLMREWMNIIAIEEETRRKERAEEFMQQVTR